MDKVINFQDYKKDSEKEAIPKYEDYKNKKESEKEVIPKYEDLKIEMKEMISQNTKIVASNEVEAMAITEILMELDPNIRYCRLSMSMGRKGMFIDLIPVYTTDDIRYPHNNLTVSYSKYLDDIGRLIKDDNGHIISVKDKE